ncbi:MAG: cation diffusion facilitator family transporter [Myxococcales bacterium]|nr:cation diffusion facilitator family transporter [Myxococcales bacterium]
MDVSDIVLNLVVYWVTGSAVLFAEMALGLADTFGSLLLVIGERRSRRPRSAEHPRGHSREVFFWALLSSISMLVLGSGLATLRGVEQWLEPQAIDAPWLGIGVLGLSLLTNGWTVRLEWRRLAGGRGSLRRAWASGAQPLVETAFVRDALGTLSALLGLLALAAYLLSGRTLFDALGAFGIAGLTALSSLLLVARARGLIAGRAVAPAIQQAIRRAVLEVEAVDVVNGLVAVHSGAQRVAVDVDVALRDGLDTDAVERAVDAVQAAVRRACPQAATVHVELNPPSTSGASPSPR